jgi:hypothetical protein
MSEPLEPNRDQIEIFVDAIFRRAAPQGYVAVRSFFEDDNAKPARLSSAGLCAGFKFLVDVAEDDARRAAQHPRPIVFCPPLATFAGKDRARESDIAEGLALSVECDERPLQARATLEAILGPATVVVKSGGRYMNGGGNAEDKLHLHWRLAKPARGRDLAKLKQARDLAARIVGGDPSNKPVCHPIRWPGSWHRKDEPRLCEIIDLDHLDDEIDLDQALAKLESAVKTEERGAAQAAVRDGPLDWASAFGRILSGEEYHPTLAPLAASFARAGLAEPLADYILDCLLKNSRPPDPERLRRREAELAKLQETVRSAYAKFAPDNQQVPGLNVWDAGAVAAPPGPRAWLLGTAFCRTFLSSLIAEGGAGKTAVRYAQYLSLATGRPLTGEHVFQRCRVLIVSLEDDAEELNRRIFAARLRYAISAEAVKGWLFLSAPGAAVGKLMQMDQSGRKATLGPLAKHLEQASEQLKPDLVALDPYIKAHGLPESDNALMDMVAQLLADLARKYNIAVDFVHHQRKGSAEPGNADRGRGASATKDAGRLVYTLTTMSPAEAKAFDITEERRRSFVRMDSAKVNIAPPMTKAKWLRLVGVPLDNGTDLYPNGDEVQTVEPWSPPETWEGVDIATINQILDTIAAGLPDGERYTDGAAAKTRAAWKAAQQHAPGKTETQCREMIRQWIKNGVLSPETYYSKAERKECVGLRINDANRPGAEAEG